jgi:AAA15 family ATPase/GTPase
MITELRLENWKSFGEATLYIDPLSILIGTNASGKSNVLDALQFLQNIAAGKSLTEALNNLRGGLDWGVKKFTSYFELSVFFKFDNDSYKYHIKCSVIGDKCVGEEEGLFFLKNDVYESIFLFGKKDMGKWNNSVAYMAYNALSDLNESVDGKKGISGLIDVLNNIFLFNPLPLSMIGYSPLAESIASNASNIAGVLAALSSERQKEIEETLTQYASRLPERDIHRVYAEKVGKLGKDAMLYCDEKWGESGEVFTVDARAMSDGTLRFLAILTALLTLPEGSLLAIDEVDNGFHPSRAHLLLEALQTIGKQRNIDVLVTTHNPALLDALGTEFVPFVTVAHRDSITGESKLTLLEDIEQLPKLLAQGTVGKLSTQGLIEKSLESVHG